MEEIEDKEFGKMIYDSGWVKTEEIQLWERNFTLEIMAHAYTGNQILPIQRERYKYFKQQTDAISVSSCEALLCYYKENYDLIKEVVGSEDELYLPENITKTALLFFIEPRAVVFMRNGESGILCDCEWEPEDGLVIKFDDGIEIGTQDLIL